MFVGTGGFPGSSEFFVTNSEEVSSSTSKTPVLFKFISVISGGIEPVSVFAQAGAAPIRIEAIKNISVFLSLDFIKIKLSTPDFVILHLYLIYPIFRFLNVIYSYDFILLQIVTSIIIQIINPSPKTRWNKLFNVKQNL